MVPLHSVRKRPILRAACSKALPWRRPYLRLSALLRIDVCESARIVAISGGTEGTKNPHEPGREPEPIRRFPFAPQGNALAHIQPASSSSRPRYSPTRISLTGLTWRGRAGKELEWGVPPFGCRLSRCYAAARARRHARWRPWVAMVTCPAYFGDRSFQENESPQMSLTRLNDSAFDAQL